MPADVVKLSDIADANGWSAVRKQLGVASFGINAWTVEEAGQDLISDHDEKPSGHEELYVVIAGRATFTVDGEEIDAPTGTAVFVRDPASQRRAVAVEVPSTVLVLGGKPGEAYAPRSWETNAAVLPLFGDGKFEEAKQELQAGLAVYDDHEVLHYNLACAESRLGNTDAAFDHLRRSLELRPAFAEQARGDEDLEALRADPRFAELVTPG